VIERGLTGVATGKPRSDENASVRPSGANAGSKSPPGSFVILRAAAISTVSLGVNGSV
jgi:hypothetical protein